MEMGHERRDRGTFALPTEKDVQCRDRSSPFAILEGDQIAQDRNDQNSTLVDGRPLTCISECDLG